MTPAWILDIFAAIMLAVAAVGATRLIAVRAWSRPSAETDIDAAHVLMGVAMAGMLAGGLRTLPNAAWAVIFAVVTGWFAWRVAGEARQRRAGSLAAGHHLPHLLHAAAMVYMFVAVTAPTAAAGSAMGGMSAGSGADGMGSLRLPELGLVFVLVMAGWAVWDLNQLTGPPGLQPVALAAAAPGPVPVHAQAAAAPAAQVPATRVLLDARVTVASRIAMGVTMALMLVLMI